MTLTERMIGILEARGLDVELADRLGLETVQRGGTDLPPDLLRSLLIYDPDTGDLTWRERPLGMFPSLQSGRTWNSRYAGTAALTAISADGYRVGIVLYRRLLAHRVAWAIHFGAWPEGQIDHENHDRADNRIVNLREASGQENARNQKRSVANTSGVTGVSYSKRAEKWVAYIRSDGRRVHLGRYDDFNAAVSARRNAEVAFGYHRNHGAAV